MVGAVGLWRTIDSTGMSFLTLGVGGDTVKMELRSRGVNNGTELLPYLVSSGQRSAIGELTAQLNPMTGPITRVVSYFGADGQLHVCSGHAEQYDLTTCCRDC